ncbi:hypothetical protein [Streptosporangium sp. 'caverna']|uniref:hypothetical protein n=1 Tax=Streptosporangium sp. 'caverna' TaxID=2202249 RepID=UPI00195502FF|nr:hypothetical protein [Streptosporangium sp. 'caverna']
MQISFIAWTPDGTAVAESRLPAATVMITNRPATVRTLALPRPAVSRPYGVNVPNVALRPSRQAYRRAAALQSRVMVQARHRLHSRSQSQARSEPQSRSQTRSRPESQAQSQNQPKNRSQSRKQSRKQAKDLPRSRPEDRPAGQAQPQSLPKSQPAAQPKAAVPPQPKAAVPPQPKAAVPPQPKAAVPPQPKAAVPPQVQQRLPVRLQHLQATERLKQAGLNWTSSGKCSNRHVGHCTSLQAVRAATVDEVIALKQRSQCPIVITGGTEVGHAPGPYSHHAGYKLDIKPNKCINDYIKQLPPQGVRGDGARLYGDPLGILYARESNHWDILFMS